MIGFFFAIPKRLTMYKLLTFILTVFSMSSNSQNIRIATFNVSMDATNYVAQNESPIGDELQINLSSGKHKQIQNIAEIIQRLSPDIILLNEFDYSNQSTTDAQNFI